jgi:hypothetical protein
MRFSRGVASLAAGLGLLLAGLDSVHSQGETIDLKYKLAKGETLTYAYAFSKITKIALYSPPVLWADEGRITGEYTVNVKTYAGMARSPSGLSVSSGSLHKGKRKIFRRYRLRFRCAPVGRC